ncbi:hypothetical protein [Azospirillum sp. TSO35-2]|uniref:hypothetical protein n=1 Tax=Azospirillum sp. TSO35-2 TaxID=716796 RepID=UPI000D612967|nr:hypothetical protein [Azospirillum sp. TSO35-2]PWC31058.1 hypothetical protein TSO352_29925 [Azospirillum sp. TSO35-2]
MSHIIEVPITLRIKVSGASDAQATARQAAEHFSHVSHAQIAAFNEVNRVHGAESVVVEAVTSVVSGAGHAA